MNTINFSAMYEPRTFTHNVEIYGKKNVTINGTNYEVDSHSQIMVYPTIKCNADCDFCLNKFDNTLTKCTSSISDEQYISKLRTVFELLKEAKPSLSICGGEPSMSSLTVKIMELAKEYGITHRIFATNGVGLLHKYGDRVLLQHMKDNNATNNINISKASYDITENKEIMKYNISEKDLRAIGTFCSINRMTARLSCVLHNKGVNSLDKIIEYYEKSKSLGFKSSIFREQIKVDEEFKEQSFVDSKQIMKIIENDSRFKYIRTLDGAYYKVDVYRYKDSIVKCYTEKFNAETNFIRDFVYLPNGDLCIAKYYGNDKKIL